MLDNFQRSSLSKRKDSEYTTKEAERKGAKTRTGSRGHYFKKPVVNRHCTEQAGMPISAALVARDNVVLCEYAPGATNFGVIARRLLKQLAESGIAPSGPSSNMSAMSSSSSSLSNAIAGEQRKSYSYEDVAFHFIRISATPDGHSLTSQANLVFLCMSDLAMQYALPFEFLSDIKRRFLQSYGAHVATALHLAMNDGFSRVLQDRMDFYSSDRGADRVTRVRRELDDTKNIMVRNLDKVIARGEQIEELVDKTDDLATNAVSFKRKSVQVRKKMWWQNFKMTLCLACVCLCVVTAIVVGGLFYFKVLPPNTSSDGGGGGGSRGASTSSTSSAPTTTPLSTSATSAPSSSSTSSSGFPSTSSSSSSSLSSSSSSSSSSSATSSSSTTSITTNVTTGTSGIASTGSRTVTTGAASAGLTTAADGPSGILSTGGHNFTTGAASAGPTTAVGTSSSNSTRSSADISSGTTASNTATSSSSSGNQSSSSTSAMQTGTATANLTAVVA